jgi:hypothetical protein
VPQETIVWEVMDILSSLFFSDSVEAGEKLVKTALDTFGRIGDVFFHL